MLLVPGRVAAARGPARAAVLAAGRVREIDEARFELLARQVRHPLLVAVKELVPVVDAAMIARGRLEGRCGPADAGTNQVYPESLRDGRSCRHCVAIQT